MKKQNTTYYICLFFAGIIFSSCAKDPKIIVEPDAYVLNVPSGFVFPNIPEDNPLTTAKIALGKKLFYEKALSVDSTISCGTCHKQEFAFSDNVAVTAGVEGRLGFRNAPTLTNIAWSPEMLMDGGNPTLETQVYVPIETHFEMDFNMVLLVNRLNADDEYVDAFNNVFGTNPDPFGITRALAAFERTIISGNTRFDQYYYQGKTEVLNEQEINGMQLFFSPALKCASCHSGYLFTDFTYQNNGFFADYSADSGRARISLLSEDVGKFKVPTLRNIALTGPYMHNGQINSLEAIIDSYANGGSGHINQSELIQGFVLTAQEKENLILFLNTLTDNQFINNPDLGED
ncbi:MAG TPA: cytochrome c peroxidase [Chitinophagales bacterium]|nr:cytochrome c peroxidase [Chitinophagales bacterium]